MSTHGATASEVARPKRRCILDGARAVFAEQGFERATVDQIAARAGVSKATVYNHFEDKRALFVATVVECCDDVRAALERCLEGPVGDAAEGLRIIGEQLMLTSLSPSVVDLFRQAIPEVPHIPEIGRMVFERATLAVQEIVASHLRRWHAAGALRVEDPRAAAIAFIALCQGDLVVRTRLGVLERPADQQISETVRRAVEIFVRAYAPGA